MNHDNDRHKPALTVLPGGKSDVREFASLPLDRKLAMLQSFPASRKMELILDDPAAAALVHSFQPQELYWLVEEIGITDAQELIALASPDQCRFFLDMELWDKESFVPDKAWEWFGHLLEMGEERITKLLPELDHELLLLFLTQEITVGGGIGDLINDEERLFEWDHTFDELYFISYREPRHAQLVGTLLDIIYRHYHDLYRELMEGVKHELFSEVEELAGQFRSGRLADLGFPDPLEAAALYAYLNPATFSPATDKGEVIPTEADQGLPVTRESGDSFLFRVLAGVASEGIYQELNYLVNTALVAEGATLSDVAALQSVMERVYGCLNIALEELSGGDEGTGREMVTGEYLKRLFQFGFSLLLDLQRQAAEVRSDNYAVNKALKGLKAKRPRFYRGLDPDHADGYREFRTLADVQTVREFLRILESGAGD
jgi:hypothetical protein